MSKKLMTVLALAFLLTVAGAAVAETPDVAADQDVATVLGLDQESCEAPVESTEPAADLDVENELRFDAAGEVCGSRICGAKQFCCNFSCSICAPLDGACTQQVC